MNAPYARWATSCRSHGEPSFEKLTSAPVRLLVLSKGLQPVLAVARMMFGTFLFDPSSTETWDAARPRARRRRSAEYGSTIPRRGTVLRRFAPLSDQGPVGRFLH
jgi:hypothetical protein